MCVCACVCVQNGLFQPRGVACVINLAPLRAALVGGGGGGVPFAGCCEAAWGTGCV